MNIRLEYSPMLGQFNLAGPTDRPDVARGFKTICCFVNIDRAARFTQAINEKFPSLKGDASDYPSLQVMRHELLQFIEEDVKLVEQQMSRSFQRRKYIFNNRK